MKRSFLLKCFIVFALVLGFMLKAYYVSYTEVWERQHDVIGFDADEGQAAYIEYILENRALPDFDPRQVWGFFQPPLHHIVSAACIYLSELFGASWARARENIQILTLMYMTLVMLLTYLICKKAAIGDKGTLIATLIVSFHPIFILLSGSINNDALSLMLSLLSVYLAACWYEKPTIIRIISLALAIGLSMMAKFTGGLIAPAIGILILMKLKERFKDAGRERGAFIPVIKRYGLQILCFALIVFPLGLWWPARNKIRWDMPVNYIPPVGEQLEKTDIFSRVFDIRTKSPFAYMISSGYGYDEYNTFLALVKTSLFGEYDYGQYSHKIIWLSWALLITSVFLIIIAFIATFYVCFSKGFGMKVEWRVLLGICYLTYLVSYLSFSLGYSNFSAQDFRYGAICIVMEAVFLGAFYDKISGGKESPLRKYTGKAIAILTALFAVLSLSVYVLLGLRT